MFLSVPDQDGFCFTQAYQSIGLGLASAIGSAIARPDRLTVAALGDGGALMGISELETAVRLSLPMVIVVYDDEAYGAEVHHFGPDGYPLDTVRFPAADIAAIARGFGCTAVTVRAPADLGPVREWLESGPTRPIVIDAKVTAERGCMVARGGFPRPLSCRSGTRPGGGAPGSREAFVLRGYPAGVGWTTPAAALSSVTDHLLVR